MLELTRGRVSQLVSEGKLEGCFHGEGRARRFDPAMVAQAIGRRLDPGQRLGNGSRTQEKARKLLDGESAAVGPQRGEPNAARRRDATTRLAEVTANEYERARTEKAIEETCRIRRMNEEAEGRFVLVEEVSRQVRRQLGQEIAEVNTFIRDAARRVADRHGVEFKAVRQQMIDIWREHRAARSKASAHTASAAVMSEDELASDI